MDTKLSFRIDFFISAISKTWLSSQSSYLLLNCMSKTTNNNVIRCISLTSTAKQQNMWPKYYPLILTFFPKYFLSLLRVVYLILFFKRNLCKLLKQIFFDKHLTFWTSKTLMDCLDILFLAYAHCLRSFLA